MEGVELARSDAPLAQPLDKADDPKDDRGAGLQAGEEEEDGRFPAPGKRFDASQYAFFGQNVKDEVEIGGLEEDALDDGEEDGDGTSNLDAEAETGSAKCASDLGDVSGLAFSLSQLGKDARGSEIEAELPDEASARQRLDGGSAHGPAEVSLSANLFNRVNHMQYETQASQEPEPSWVHNRGPDQEGRNIGLMWPPFEPQQRMWMTGLPSPLHPSAALHQALPTLPGLQQTSHVSSLLPPQVALQYRSHPGDTLLKTDAVFHPPHQFPRPLVGVGPEENIHFRDTQAAFHAFPRGYGEAKHHRNDWQSLRSKYMTAEEIDNILRIQWTATHSTDPYVDDYYHQAVQMKSAEGSLLGRRRFAPSHIRNVHSHSRSTGEPHAYLQVDALGRVPFSSIHRPRPLLDVDLASDAGELTTHVQQASLDAEKPSSKPLEQEPMLAIRIAIEDAFSSLLDVDDIDRLLTAVHPSDGGVHLRQHRQFLLRQLAALLRLTDTDGDPPGTGIRTGLGTSTSDSLHFLRFVSLPKGRKFLTRYMQLLPPEIELVQIVAVAVFQHLRFLFDVGQSDSTASAPNGGLAKAAATSAMILDLPALSACLAAVVLAAEKPPLRPIGSPLGDGATVVLKALLERATYLLTNRSGSYPFQNRAVWQSSFDAFFNMLLDYCTSKYDGILHSLRTASAGNAGPVRAAASVSMRNEIPVELLRASLPHTNDLQRSVLLEFSKRSFSIGALSGAAQ